ncbi:hypothetical protein TRIUR3_22546 [Triticum urartu]|uniref:PRA1 family protein n=1 Tax=Triticum urartu TaxID=4572 RepID=M7Z576_TRIUA|nr:hypothetical protein TRIUR3_22546 [Triticum urartu]
MPTLKPNAKKMTKATNRREMDGRSEGSYRTNYFILIMFILGLGFLWKPVAILAAFMTGFSIAFLNDSFAVTFNEKVTRTVRQFSPHLAAKMRPPIT